jgi:hypothetical protein
VTLGISRKRKEEPGRIVDNRLDRPVKSTKFPISAAGSDGRCNTF